MKEREIGKVSTYSTFYLLTHHPIFPCPEKTLVSNLECVFIFTIGLINLQDKKKGHLHCFVSGQPKTYL